MAQFKALRAAVSWAQRDSRKRGIIRSATTSSKYEDQTLGKEVTAFGIVPKMSLAPPGQVLRGSSEPRSGHEHDPHELLGYDDAKIADLKEKDLI